MAEIKKIIYRIELIKWVVFPSLIFALFGGLGGQKSFPFTQYESATHLSGSSKSAFDKIHDSDLSSFYKVFGDFEIEEIEEEEEGDDDRHYSNRKSSQPLSLALALKEITSVSLFPPQKLIKLFILFHSWKSFLLI